MPSNCDWPTSAWITHASDSTDFSFEGGQDWTLFGSTALPNILETTFLGAYYGDVYERSPQMMVGFVQKLGGSVKLDPTFAIMMPTSSQIEKLGSLGPAAQLAEAEREGADSDRPEWEGRAGLAVPARQSARRGSGSDILERVPGPAHIDRFKWCDGHRSGGLYSRLPEWL